jgi:hypothetical protein
MYRFTRRAYVSSEIVWIRVLLLKELKGGCDSLLFIDYKKEKPTIGTGGHIRLQC